MWDGLLKRHPNLEIDNANWRITGPDIEAMKRTIGSLTRSEITSGGLPHPVSDQAQTAELSLWIPLDANLLHGLTPYSFRSTATTGVGIGLDLRSDYIPRDQLTKGIIQLKELRPYWLGDYYPLTAIDFEESTWCAWQFDRPDLKAGYAIFFRRPKSSVPEFDAALRGLDPKASYDVYFFRKLRREGKSHHDRRRARQSAGGNWLCAGRHARALPKNQGFLSVRNECIA